MKLRFKVQRYQTEAVDAVVDAFAGQPHRPGVANAEIAVTSADLLKNVNDVQRIRNLPLSERLVDSTGAPGVLNLDVEMETGTGKTYVYIRTILELNKRYGWSRFVVVVPSIAIREGVKRSFDVTADHFQEMYGTRARTSVYSSSPVGLRGVERFAADPGVQVLIINVQAFNAPGRESRRIYEELDAFQGRRPIDVLRETRPIVILDEPQKIGSVKSLQSLSRFEPLFMVRYSATHRVEHVKVHRLDAVDALNRGLVKKIAVRGMGDEDCSRDELRRLQIRAVVRAHLEKERELFARGVKVLSLFFIDEVVKYRDYSRPGALGLYARIFEDEYRHLRNEFLGEPGYGEFLLRDDVSAVHAGYFSVDKKTKRWVDGEVCKSGDEAGLSKDVGAYDLILRDQERLLSMDEPVRFIFSHSALREGWDNPNVFVMGMLKQSGTTISRRQEVGRGLRLAVDQRGDRVEDRELNELTVVTDESYASFVEGLQREVAGSFPMPVDDRVYRRNILVGDLFEGNQFRALWRSINHRATYRIRLDSVGLIKRCTAVLDQRLAPTSAPASACVDVVGEIAAGTGLTRRTVGAVLEGVADRTLAQLQFNVENFVSEAVHLIGAEKAALMVEGISYSLRESRYGEDLFIAAQTRQLVGEPVAKHIYRYAAPASDAERAFVAQLEADPAVAVYARLPCGYAVPTPFGDYLPEWAVALHDGRAFFVHLTALDERLVQCARRFLHVLPRPVDLWPAPTTRLP